MNNLEILQNKAKKIVSNVSNDPEGRLQLRYKFYQKYGNPIFKGKDGLGNSEIDFMKWEIARGVLNPLDAERHGSKWWREVNSRFLYVSELAGLIYDVGITYNGPSEPIKFWLAYLENRDGATWYRAHNSSIIDGYKVASELALEETCDERKFMNIVLYRVLYAQSMIEGANFGLLGEFLADPRGPAVGIITSFEDFYPKEYPLTKAGIKAVTHKSHSIMGLVEDFMDKVLILSQLGKLYKEAEQWNKSPILATFINKNKPNYAITADCK
ncbi:MAG: hypothetical protein AAF611_16125 [Bacteroidota bacterium]